MLVTKKWLLGELLAFSKSDALMPIRIKVTLKEGMIKYKIVDGYHRFKAAHLLSLQEIPVSYNQEVYDDVWRELHQTPSKEKYVPPHLREQQQ